MKAPSFASYQSTRSAELPTDRMAERAFKDNETTFATPPVCDSSASATVGASKRTGPAETPSFSRPNTG